MHKIENKSQENFLVYLLYATAAYFGFKYLINKNNIPQSDTTTAFNSNSKPSSNPIKLYLSEQFPLRKGMKGKHIASLQARLNLKTNGIFDDRTEAYLLQYYGTASINQQLYDKITNPLNYSWHNLIRSKKTIQGTLLKKGSTGYDVYRLQKWLGFKDSNQAKNDEPKADAIMGKQTINALQKKTGKTEINTTQLNEYLIHG